MVEAVKLLKPLVLILAGALLLVAVWYPLRYSLPGPLGATDLPAPRESPPVSAVARADFVGAPKCAGCHAAEFAKWEKSTHGRAGGAASPDVVIAAFNGQPIRFRDAVVTPRIRDGAYEFVVAQEDIPTEVIRVDGVVGGGHMEGGGTQGFVTKRSDGTMRFVPFDWSRHGKSWFCNTNSRSRHGWVPISTSMRLAECGDWPPTRVFGEVARWANCQNCHASQLAVEDSAGRAVTRFTSLAINCESCHGPGRKHVQLAESGEIAKNADVGLVSLRTLDKDASLRVCFQCHAVKDHLHSGYLPGDALEQFYSLRLPNLGDRPLHTDGRVRTFAYQESHRYSDCYVNGGMTCTSCHDPHSQGYRTISEEPLVGRTDNGQCTSCHVSKAADVTAHTRHATNSAGSKCTACHMPYLQEPETEGLRPKAQGGSGSAVIRYARSDHSIPIPRPMTDALNGIPPACAQCHANRSLEQLDEQVSSMWGPLKPTPIAYRVQWRAQTAEMKLDRSLAPTVDGTAENAAIARGLQLAPLDSIGKPHEAAAFAGIARFLERNGKPEELELDPGERGWLRTRSRSSDVDTRALALATLHYLNGARPDVKRELARAAAREGKQDFALRSRWSVILGSMGDRDASKGDHASAVTAYTRALEVTPQNPRILMSLGNAQLASGNPAAAIASYERGVALDPRSALLRVNLGIAYQALGDSSRGQSSFRDATEADPNEPLGWFNLGNAIMQRGDVEGAAPHFRRAVDLDGSLVEAHFQLARVHLLRRDERAALAELRQGLAIDSTNAAARELAAQLTRSLRR
jgi:tetratricopeptide (TPR) repeat protein